MVAGSPNFLGCQPFTSKLNGFNSIESLISVQTAKSLKTLLCKNGRPSGKTQFFGSLCSLGGWGVKCYTWPTIQGVYLQKSQTQGDIYSIPPWLSLD